MKKQIAILATVLAVGSLSAFGQGYFNFSTGGGYVYDDFTTSGTGVKAPGDVTVTFLWAPTGTADPLGAGLATTGVQGATAVSDIESMLSSGWTIASASSIEADNTVHASGPTQGGIGYGTFQVDGTTGGNTYELVVVGWASADGATLSAALTDPTAFGWSSSFNYASSASSLVASPQFSSSGLTAFGVAPVPEPTTLALAGLGGLSMLFLRRRKA